LPAAPACAASMIAFSVGFVAAPHTKRPRRGEWRRGRLGCEIRRAATASFPVETCGAPVSLFRFDHSCRFSPKGQIGRHDYLRDATQRSVWWLIGDQVLCERKKARRLRSHRAS
jgi:hypothetical protein